MSDGLRPGFHRGFFYLKSVCLITKIGKAIKIKAKPSKKQSPTNNNCITAIDNATPYATLTIKNRAIKAIIFFHPFYPFGDPSIKPRQSKQAWTIKTIQRRFRSGGAIPMKCLPGCSFPNPFRCYGNPFRSYLAFPIRIAAHPIVRRLPGSEKHCSERITRQGSRWEFDISRPSPDLQSPTIKPCHCRTIVQTNRAYPFSRRLRLLRE